eukprot:TRINITY_DN1204_c0_g2_i1.p1 TRINITY_DN1204_c0_g2~~TRINITY_DN1204_c0_g2_i1.p1  ORF type:complete len:794 (-),score=119.34 TRINITY_DN1204_c0_g2_i1:3492-5873(-)
MEDDGAESSSSSGFNTSPGGAPGGLHFPSDNAANSMALKRKRFPGLLKLDIPVTEEYSGPCNNGPGPPLEITEDVLSESCQEGPFFAVICKKGKRGHLEDTCEWIPEVNGDPAQAYFGVYDGHGGRKAVRYALDNLSGHVIKCMVEADESEEEQIQAIEAAYRVTDEGFCALEAKSGASCVSSIVRHGKLYVANAGDCRAVLCRGGLAEQLSYDHRASDPSEKKRVESHENGIIAGAKGRERIHNRLAVSRGIGDYDLKTLVISTPHIRVLPITSDCEFVIMASDGLWDTFKNDEAVAIARKIIGAPPSSSPLAVPAPPTSCDPAPLAVEDDDSEPTSVVQLMQPLSVREQSLAAAAAGPDAVVSKNATAGSEPPTVELVLPNRPAPGAGGSSGTGGSGTVMGPPPPRRPPLGITANCATPRVRGEGAPGGGSASSGSGIPAVPRTAMTPRGAGGLRLPGGTTPTPRSNPGRFRNGGRAGGGRRAPIWETDDWGEGQGGSMGEVADSNDMSGFYTPGPLSGVPMTPRGGGVPHTPRGESGERGPPDLSGFYTPRPDFVPYTPRGMNATMGVVDTPGWYTPRVPGQGFEDDDEEDDEYWGAGGDAGESGDDSEEGIVELALPAPVVRALTPQAAAPGSSLSTAADARSALTSTAAAATSADNTSPQSTGPLAACKKLAEIAHQKQSDDITVIILLLNKFQLPLSPSPSVDSPSAASEKPSAPYVSRASLALAGLGERRSLLDRAESGTRALCGLTIGADPPSPRRRRVADSSLEVGVDQELELPTFARGEKATT